MNADPFAERLAKVRGRFIASLPDKIERGVAALPSLTAEASAAADSVANTYREIHSISGIGPTIGFATTGDAARQAELVLLPAYHERRGLSPDESDAFAKALDALRQAARHDLQSL